MHCCYLPPFDITHLSALNEEFWQYNTFQYWRNPLPPIDLADIEAINEGNLTEARLQSKDEVVEIDMES
ncbi:hypothetical protein D623_10034414 [Myotis brandtii]|uniref:Putative WW-binding domain-containing protein n=1 Tax=Myotis brandtii TaxID=109478 RepID=S7MWN7_MYOBR|nr:hypothetical protein D623_10034414 [Myotis brandtii]